jgi:TusA-related sulfurtransferase
MENKKEQQRVCNVKEKVRHVVPSRLQSKELNIHHVGDPGQGVPVRGLIGRECPPNAIQRNTVLDLMVRGYVVGIVVRNEIAIIDLPECKKGRNYQKQVNYDNLLIL